MTDNWLHTTPGGNKTILTAAITVAGSQTGATLVAAVTGKKIRVFSLAIVCTAATTVKLLSNTTAKTGIMSFPTQGGLLPTVTPPSFIMETTISEALKVTTGAGGIEGFVSYWLE